MRNYAYLTLFVFMIFTVTLTYTIVDFVFRPNQFTLDCTQKAPGIVSCEVK